jgi:hypothetical protein
MTTGKKLTTKAKSSIQFYLATPSAPHPNRARVLHEVVNGDLNFGLGGRAISFYIDLTYISCIREQ